MDYLVTVLERQYVTYAIEANSEAEALEKVSAGLAHLVNREYSDNCPSQPPIIEKENE